MFFLKKSDYFHFIGRGNSALVYLIFKAIVAFLGEFNLPPLCCGGVVEAVITPSSLSFATY